MKKLKKIYYLDFNTEYGSDLIWELCEEYVGERGFYDTRKEATQVLIQTARRIKEIYKDELKLEGDNVLTMDLYVGHVPNDFDEGEDDFYEASDDYHIVESRYLCGRY